MADFNFEQFGRDFLQGVNDAATNVSDLARSVGDDAGRYKDFLQTGRYLDSHDLISSHGGNLSVCDGRTLWITRTKAMLDTLVPGDIIACSILDELAQAASDAQASRELPVHRAIYQAAFAGKSDSGWSDLFTAQLKSDQSVPGEAEQKNILAIVHAHPLAAITLSLAAQSIEPQDSEGRSLLGLSVPIVMPSTAVLNDGIVKALARSVNKDGACVMISAHGSFALSHHLLTALQLTVALERSAKIILLTRSSA